LIISVIGESQSTKTNTALAFEVGRLLAVSGVSLVCGGLGGIMEAACHGSKSEGGMTIGILPGFNPNEGNAWVDIPICTGLGYARNIIVVRSGLAVIAIGGAYGTLSEISNALAENKSVIGLNTWELRKNGNIDSGIIISKDPEDAVRKAISESKRN
jgi:uncharacterized protein (TIGR00725 family)